MLKIEGRNVGKLIGVRGATIKQIQEQYNVRISISKEDDEVILKRLIILRIN